MPFNRVGCETPTEKLLHMNISVELKKTHNISVERGS